MKKLLLLVAMSLGLGVYAQQIYQGGSPNSFGKFNSPTETVRKAHFLPTSFNSQTQQNETETLPTNGSFSVPTAPKTNPAPAFTTEGYWGSVYNIDTKEYEYYTYNVETYKPNQWSTYYTALNMTFVDETFQEISAPIRIEFPDVTNHFYIYTERTSAYFMIYDHFFRGGSGPDFQVHRIRVIDNQGNVIYEEEERDGVSLDAGKLVLWDAYGDKPTCSVHIHDRETFELEHTFEVQTTLIRDLGGPFFFSTEFEGETYFVVNQLEQELMDMMTYELNPDNEYIMTFYDTDYEVVKTVEIAIDEFNPEGIEFGLYPMPGYGMFRKEFDITTNIFSSSGKWEFVIPVYIMTFMGEWYEFYVFDEDGTMIKSYTQEVSDYLYLSDIDGFEHQMVCVVEGENYSQQLAVFNIESFTVETVFNAMHNGTDHVSLSFDRFQKDDTYEYIISLGNTETIDGILRCLVKTYDRDGVETRKITLPMQAGGWGHTAYPTGALRNPYLLNSDEELDITYAYRMSSGFIFGIAQDGDDAPFFEITDGASGSGFLFDAKGMVPKYMYVNYATKSDFYALPLAGTNVDVTINVTTNNPAVTAAGAEVVLSHTITEIGYAGTVSGAGNLIVADMFRGSYDVTITKAGFYPYTTTITMPATAATATFGAYQLQMYNAPANLTGVSASGNVTLSWNAPEVYAPLSVVGYNVYRNGVKINTVPVSSTTYQNMPDPAGTYSYYVTAVMSDGIETVPSNEISINTRYSIIAASVQGNGTITPMGDVSVNYGAEQTFTFAPGDAYIIVQLLVDGVHNAAAMAAGSYTFTNVTAAHTIEAVFVPSEYTINAVAGAGGTISPSGVVGVSYGDDRMFVFNPSVGYNVAAVLIDGVNNEEAVAAKMYTFENIQGNHTISVSFQLYGHTITATAGEGGNINPEGQTIVNHGQAQFYSFTPNVGYKVSQVLIDGVNNQEAVNSGMYTFSNVTAAHTIHADFVLKSYAITASATTGGTITPSGVTEVTHGGEATFAFAADANYTLAQVLVDGVNNAAAVTAGSFTFSNVTAAHGIQAVFVAKSYEIVATAGEGGRISPEGTAMVAHGSEKTYHIYPNTGFEISKVLVDGENNAAAVSSGSYTFSNITASHTIAAEFTAITFKITASVDGANGEISPKGDIEVAYGETPTFTFTPSAGYKVASALVDGENKPAAVNNGSYTFAPVVADHSIVVSFEKTTYMITAVATGEGTISPAGDVAVEHGANQTFTFAPAEGYQVGRVIVDHIIVETTDSYTFENVTEKHRIEVVFVKKVGIEENATVQLSTYPNPTSGELRVRNEEVGIRNVRVYNITGKLIQEIDNVNNTELSLDISSFANGIYFIDVDGKTVKVIKQ